MLAPTGVVSHPSLLERTRSPQPQEEPWHKSMRNVPRLVPSIPLFIGDDHFLNFPVLESCGPCQRHGPAKP